MFKGYEAEEKENKCLTGRGEIRSDVEQKNRMKSETDEWTDGTRNEMIQREMKGERGWMLCDNLEEKDIDMAVK